MRAVAGQLFDAVVLGAGPAGVAAAVGLARLGHKVGLVSRARAPSVEGLSMRALNSLSRSGPWQRGRQRLRAGGATRLLGRATIHAWPGMSREAGRIRCSVDFRPAGQRGHSIDSTVRSFESTDNVWQVETTGGLVCGRTVLDARGRRARRSDRRGPLLVAWNTTYQTSERSAPGSAVAALDDGWCWVARTADGLLSLQFVGAAGEQLCSEAAGSRPRSARCLRLARF